MIKLLILIFLTSCSTLQKSLTTGSMVGGMVGGVGGALFSPNEASQSRNAYLFGVTGALIGAGIAYLLHDDPKKKSNQSMMLDAPKETHQEVPLFDFSPELSKVKPEVSFKPIKKFEVPQEKLPPELEGKVKKQYIIEYEAEARTIEINNRTIQISPFKAWEHTYED